MNLNAPRLALLLLLAACGGDREVETEPAETVESASASSDGQPEAVDRRADERWAITTANPHATEAGAMVLRRGGSAVDAAIAVQAVLGLVEPQSSGLGGGAFMLFWDAQSSKLTAYDGREIAPLSATPEMFLKEDGTRMGYYDAVTSGLSVGVPGVVAMLDLAHAEHGRLPWTGLFDPAIELAEDGFAVSTRLNYLLGRTRRLVDNDDARSLFYDGEGRPIAVGTTLRNPDYAATLRTVAESGAGAFYTGDIAEAIIEAVNAKAGPGTMTAEDLAGYEPLVREPVCAGFVSYRVCSMGPPSSGGVTVLQILEMVEATGIRRPYDPGIWPIYLEASRLAFADRNTYLADPVAMGLDELDADDIVAGLLDPQYLRMRSDLIGSASAEEIAPGDPTPYALREGRAPDASPDLPGTSHLSIRDRYGNIVSMTTTVEFAFGSHIMAGGMILNNQLTDFSFEPEGEDGEPVVNAAGFGKRPRSSMAPVIAFDADNDPVLAIGSPGGPAIIGYVAKTLLLTLGYDMDLQDAIDHPNVVVPRGDVIAERGLDPSARAAITAYGFEIETRELTSGLYGFAIRDEEIVPGVDGRREGTFETGR